MRYLLLSLLIFIVSVSFAATKEAYPFPTHVQSQRFSYLIKEFRCLVCQNEDLADSNAKLAADLRGQIYTMVQANKSDADIKHYLISRYGDFVLYKPPLQANTLVLWFGPIIFLLIGAGILLNQWRKRRG